MIIKGRSPTMRHVSRTHRVALDRLFDRINLDPKIQVKYIDTKNQLADMLTKGNFTCDEWNHLLCLSNKGTGGMECSVVLFKPRIHLFACTHPSVSNTFGLRFLFCVHASVNSFLFQTRLIMVACLFTSISLEPNWLRLTWIIPCKCLVFRVVGMVMGTSTVAKMPLPFPYGSDGDPTPRGVGFRLSPNLVRVSVLCLIVLFT